jgi:hypothetical protein
VWVKEDGTFFQPNWYKNYYDWEAPNNGLKVVDDSYSLKTNTCGAVTKTDKVNSPMQRNSIPFLAIRIVVNNLPTSGYCETRRIRRRVLKSDAELKAEYLELVARRDELLTKQDTL